jgi:hypothetical protein
LRAPPSRGSAAPCHHEKAYCVVAGIAKEIERVGLKRCRRGGKTCPNLNGEHRNVDTQGDPQDSPIGGIAALGIVIMTRLAVVNGL